jgi:hypothetical protein
MGHAVFLDGKVTGIKVSVRAGPCEDKVQVILLSDVSEEGTPNVMPSMMREWSVHEARRASALFAEAEEAFHHSPRITWDKFDRLIGLRVSTDPKDDMLHVRLVSSSDPSHSAVRKLSGACVAELISSLQQASNMASRQSGACDEED